MFRRFNPSPDPRSAVGATRVRWAVIHAAEDVVRVEWERIKNEIRGELVMTEDTAVVVRPYWHGMLCAETLSEIADRMRSVLDGHYFTLVTCNSYKENSHRFAAVDVQPSQWLTDSIREHRDPSFPGITWSTPRLSMGVHTRAKTQAEGREGKPHKFVQFTFEPDHIVIDHYAPAGYRLKWIFAVERHDAEMGPS